MRPLDILFPLFCCTPFACCTLTQVQISNGKFLGHPAPNATQVIEWLGIPYGQAPIGPLRFAAPQKYNGDNSSVIDASRYVSQTHLFMLIHDTSNHPTGSVG